MRTLSLIAIFLMPFIKSGQNDDRKIIENFIVLSANKDFDIKRIESFLIPINDEDDKISQKRQELLNFQLKGLNKELINKDLNKISIIPYKSLPGKVKEITLDKNQIEDNIYEIRYDNKYYFTVLLENHLIKSFTLVKKGSEHNKMFLII
jgi:hypothetical protein